MSGYDRDRDHRRDRPPPQPGGGRSAELQQPRLLDRTRDADKIKQIAALERKKEQQHGGHVFAEHVDATGKQLELRAAFGIKARTGEKGLRPENATRWESDAAYVTVRDRLFADPQTRRQQRDIEEKIRKGVPTKQSFERRAPLSQVLGPQWRNDVYGRSRASYGVNDTDWHNDNAHVYALFRRRSDGSWYVHTCYPNPNPTPGP